MTNLTCFLMYHHVLPNMLFNCTELPDTNHIAIVALNGLIGLVDTLTIIMFCVDILLKWIDNFIKYWKSSWNVFELLITIVVKYYLSFI